MGKKKNKRINNKNKTTNKATNKGTDKSVNRTTSKAKNKANDKTTNKEINKKNIKRPKSSNVDNEKTKMLQVVKQPKEKKHKVLKAILIIFVILILLGVLAVAGVAAGLYFGAFGDDFEITKDDLVIGTSNSVVLDKDGNIIATLAGDEKREIVSLSEMPSYLPEAFIAIEDERFREHKGVDVKRTAYAIVKFVLNGGSSSFGGSTITQQLVKNITQDKDDEGLGGIVRKLKEWVKAYKVEEFASKDQILETYLNILSMGGGSKNIHGVQLGAKYYFNKDVKDLTIEEAAYLAGINHAPNTYNPFNDESEEAKAKRMEKIKNRTNTVLAKMLELGKISQEEHDTAVAKVEEGLNFQEGTIAENIYSYHTDAMLDEVIEDFAEQNGWDKKFAETKLKSGGYTIYTTQDSALQGRMEEEFAKEKYLMYSKQEPEKHTEAAMVVIDNSTGYVAGVVGKLGVKTESRQFNIAVDGHGKQTGSVMKPLAVIAPALEEGLITAGSVYDDVLKTFKGMQTNWPKNYDNTYRGLSTVRYTIEISHNIAPVEILSELGTAKAVKFLRDMNFESIEPEKDQNLALALGGLTNGATPLEMAAGYAMIANYGEYVEPTFYTKVVDSDGNVVLESAQERKRMMSESNAYVLQNILFQPTIGSSGTARYCAIKGMDVATKTGTTNGDYDRWLCGFTPYYSAATWYGYEKDPETIKYRGSPSNPAGSIWDAIMEYAHQDLEKKRFEVPSDIKRVTICKDSGMLPGEFCNSDPRGTRTYTEVYVNGTQPTKKCTVHVQTKVCEADGTVKLANEYCTTAVNRVFITRENSDKEENWKKATDAQYMLPTETCTIHTKPVEKPANNVIQNAINNIVNNVLSNKNNNTLSNKVNNTVNNVVNNTVSDNANNVVNNTVSSNTTNNTINNTTVQANANTVTNSASGTNTTINAVLNNVVNQITNSQ